MVVCKVVRIRNATQHKFWIVPAGDLFNSPRIGGEPAGSKPFGVPPGADLEADGLVVPWAAVTRAGLVIRQEGSNEQVRCVVGPAGSDCWDIDWLRLHDNSWEPLVQERWLALGPRHLLGGVEVLELELSLRSEGTSSGLHIADRVFFDRAMANAPPNTVLLNVYDLVSATTVANAMLCNVLIKGFGAFHAAVEVYGEEWSFYKRENPSSCGICRSRHARRHPVHVFRQSINMGATKLTQKEVWDLIVAGMARQWPSQRYDLLRSNCISFCDELLGVLGADPVPRWVRGLQDTGAALLRAPQALGSLLQGSLSGSLAGDRSTDDILPEQHVKEYFEEVTVKQASAEGEAGLSKSANEQDGANHLYACVVRAIRRSLGAAVGVPGRLGARFSALLWRS
uniref:PPPDE domain-containing protein n=1 Tax=Alexandrium catenella TaxID=2925 RepID=A0A7S1LK02_ALECA|mmetsp:Transcript_114023/g.303085  ORF Transcript_114023/g.303085 Transcript_114023/m.303085 type:complete len:397 (+) Transcript_114023:78-1268(+)